MIGTTRKQAELLDFISFFQTESGGVSPSFEEMMEAVDLQSKSGVHRLITALEERGYIRRLPNRARAIEIIPADSRPPDSRIPDVLKCIELPLFTNRQLVNELARRSERARAA